MRDIYFNGSHLDTPILKKTSRFGPVGWLTDSSSLTNEKDHHYFLNSADVCW